LAKKLGEKMGEKIYLITQNKTKLYLQKFAPHIGYF
jgi:hypothetical protein